MNDFVPAQREVTEPATTYTQPSPTGQVVRRSREVIPVGTSVNSSLAEQLKKKYPGTSLAALARRAMAVMASDTHRCWHVHIKTQCRDCGAEL